MYLLGYACKYQAAPCELQSTFAEATKQGSDKLLIVS